jgi:hypothetical protein
MPLTIDPGQEIINEEGEAEAREGLRDAGLL